MTATAMYAYRQPSCWPRAVPRNTDDMATVSPGTWSRRHGPPGRARPAGRRRRRRRRTGRHVAGPRDARREEQTKTGRVRTRCCRCEQSGQEQQQSLVRYAGADAGQQGRTDDDTERVAETRLPACGTDTPTPSAIWGSSPMVTNSVVPMPNATRARASRARAWRREPSREGWVYRVCAPGLVARAQEKEGRPADPLEHSTAGGLRIPGRGGAQSDVCRNGRLCVPRITSALVKRRVDTGGGGDPDSGREFAVDAPVTPGAVLARHPQGESPYRTLGRGAAWPFGPTQPAVTPPDQIAVPSQNGLGMHQQPQAP